MLLGMKFVLPGGSGQVGSVLSRSLARDGHEVVVLSRGAAARRSARGVAWDGRTLGPWAREIDGADVVINLASPNPLPNRDFMRELRRAAGIRFGLPATRLMLEAGAVLMRTETELVLKSRRVLPGLLLEQGFAFEYARWDAAARQLCQSRAG
jgi:NAD dependent epimerase/dehydratase family enzyme